MFTIMTDVIILGLEVYVTAVVLLILTRVIK